MAHHHNHTTENIKVAFFLNLGFAILEIIGGLAINSIAILSDALHDFGDSLSLGLAWYFERLAKKGSDEKYSYGYGRFSLLAALINSIVLVTGSIVILFEAIPRLIYPEATQARGMILFAIIGILVNGIAAFRMKGDQTMNAKVVSWHLMEDVLGWVMVLIGGILLLFFDIPFIDPLLAILLTLYILFNVAKNLKETLALFLQRTPNNINAKILDEKLCECDQVLSSHDTHIWSIDGDNHVLSTHLVIDENATKDDILRIKRECKEKLLGTVHIAHVTIEIEYPSECCGDSSTNIILNS